MIVPRSLVLGAQGTQSSAHGERGIARYVLEHIRSLHSRAPQAIAQLSVDASLQVPGSLDEFIGKVEIGFTESIPPRSGRPLVYHVMSPFETIPVERLWPRWALEPTVGLVVTLYDLIPLIHRERYLANEWIRHFYMTRLEMVRAADAVLAISQTTADDAVKHLALDPERVHTVFAGCSSFFRPPSRRREEVVMELRGQFPALQPDFYFYTGGMDLRKNVHGLIAAYGLLPDRVRSSRQLVVTCRLLPSEEQELRVLAEEAGVNHQLILTGYVPDAVLLKLYQACGLFVFPSFYEGFGLPVVEAMRCGAVVVASDIPSLRELVGDPRARFDPASPSAISFTMLRATEDDDLRAALRTAGVETANAFTWDKVAERTLHAYEAVIDERRRVAGRRRSQLALFSPMPPVPSGVADYMRRLLPDLAQLCDVDVFVDGDPADYQAVDVPGVRLQSSAHFEWLRRVERYDHVLYCMGNSEFHQYVWAALMSHPGHVLAHDVRFTGLYWWMGQQESAPPRFFSSKLRAMYGARLPSEVSGDDIEGLSNDDARRLGIFMAKEVIDHSLRVLVHCHYARQAALLECPERASRIEVVPFGFPSPVPAEPFAGPPTMTTFGIVDNVKQAPLIVRALPVVRSLVGDARLVFVGPVLPHQADELYRLAAEVGVRDAVEITGHVPVEEYRARMTSTTVALQLRSGSNGEMSAAVAECMAAGLPTVVSDIGATAELPRDAVVHVSRDIDDQELGEILGKLLVDASWRSALRERALQHATENNLALAASRIWQAIAGERP